MNIAERAKRICLSPDTEWPVIAGGEDVARDAAYELCVAAGWL